MVPFGGSLVAMAAEHFVFMSAEEGHVANGEGVSSLEHRVLHMEGTLSSIQLALDSLVAQKVASEDVGHRTSALKKPGRASVAEASSSRIGATPKKSAKPAPGYEGLDRTVVEAALQAGVAESHLEEMAQLWCVDTPDGWKIFLELQEHQFVEATCHSRRTLPMRRRRTKPMELETQMAMWLEPLSS